MPVKRRVSKRRVDPEIEFEAWEPFFEWGSPGWAGDLEDLGYPDQAAMLAGAPDAWRRLGKLFLDRRPADRERTPWAISELGAP